MCTILSCSDLDNLRYAASRGFRLQPRSTVKNQTKLDELNLLRGNSKFLFLRACYLSSLFKPTDSYEHYCSNENSCDVRTLEINPS
jgi:hypothetical protein